MKAGLFLLLSALLLASCSKHEEQPPEHSSYSYSLDGARAISEIGSPTSVTALTLPAPQLPTTAPLPLFGQDTNTFVIAQGTIITIGNTHFARILARSSDSSAITELLADSAALYAIHLNGHIDCFSFDGKQLWSASLATMPKPGALLSGRDLIVMGDSAITAIEKSNGTPSWSYHPKLYPVALALDNAKQRIILGLSGNDALATDSIIILGYDGKALSSFALERARITSNIALLAEGKFALGYVSGTNDKDGRKQPMLAVCSIADNATVKKLWGRPIEYLVTAIAATTKFILASGFRETAGDLISGIDAFGHADSTLLWKRRFSYPLVAITTVSPRYAYVPFTFSTQATVPTKTIATVLDLINGATTSEVPVPGAEAGMVQGAAMPIEGCLAYADRAKPTLYFLKP